MVRGALTVGYQAPHTWSPAERALLAAAAELVGQAAERARRFETQHGTAQLLQRSMLPEHLPDLPRLRIAARYDPGVDGNAAGGDFYDAFAAAHRRGWASCSATSPGTTCRPPRGWGRCGRRCARWR